MKTELLWECTNLDVVVVLARFAGACFGSFAAALWGYAVGSADQLAAGAVALAGEYHVLAMGAPDQA